MSPEKIKKRFQDLMATSSDRFVSFNDYSHPLACYMGINRGAPALLLITKAPAPKLRPSTALSVEYQEQAANSHYLFLTLCDSRFEDLFYIFCADLLSMMDGAKSEHQALSIFAARYSAWQDFWRNRRNALTEEQVRGLAGEILYIENRLKNGIPPNEILAAWHGIEGADQDFNFSRGWAEVKTIRQGASCVDISSLEQLDNPPGDNIAPPLFGELVVLRLHDDPAGENAFTLSELFNRVSEQLKDYPNELQIFINAVMLAGANIKTGDLENNLRLRLLELNRYNALAHDFPRLIRSDLIPPAVAGLKYRLSLPALTPWVIEDQNNETI